MTSRGMCWGPPFFWEGWMIVHLKNGPPQAGDKRAANQCKSHQITIEWNSQALVGVVERTQKTLKNGTLTVFKVDQNIKKISKEWYSQILQHKQDFHIILQLLCLPFFREKMRGKNEIQHFSSQSPVPPFYRHASVCRTLGGSILQRLGFHSIEICYDMLVWPIHSIELGVPFFRCSTSSPPWVH